MNDAVHTAMLRVYRKTPRVLRRFLVRRMTPSFRVGATVVVERPDGALLLVRPSYRRQGWGLPGGFLKRGEEPADAVAREVGEEVGLDIEVDDNPTVVVDTRYRRVDLIFTGRLPAEAPNSSEHPVPRSPEILDAQWFLPGDLPELLPETAMAFVELGRANRP